ncbi:MAG: cobyrinate a,c-diamide synthase [Oribacterium sp.]|nr:cobyrinate a,c-diamide synthase [Oribacterium sp.]
MAKRHYPRILIAATRSGAGKTTVTCGLLSALKMKGKKLCAFKCGPDYIDPMFHRTVLGIPSANLDLYFTGECGTRSLFLEYAKDAELSVIEGVMGFYDGLGGVSEDASSWRLSETIRTPVILVVDARGASVSIASLILGFKAFHPNRIRGVILNRVTAAFYPRLKEMLETRTGVRVLGYLPEQRELRVPSRHLGLFSPEELPDIQSWTERLGKKAMETLDLESILRLADVAEDFTEEELREKEHFFNVPVLPETVRVGIPEDAAFRFYYRENLDLLKRMGAELVPFHPMTGEDLPSELDGLMLGGGYPELYVRDLSENKKLRKAVRRAVRKQQMPCIAECGGFMYLQEELTDAEGYCGKMAGAIPGIAKPQGHLVRFGYLEAETLTGGLFGDAHQKIRGHEFHHWDSTEIGHGFRIRKPKSERTWTEEVYTDTLAAGYPHFYYYSNPMTLYHFLEACLRFKIERNVKLGFDRMAKPIDSLGKLEELTVKIHGIYRTEAPLALTPRALVVLAGDHGVVREGVSQTDSSVTQIVAENFAKGKTNTSLLARDAGADLFIVDVGMDTEPYPEKALVTGAVVDRKVRRGTGDIVNEKAMQYQEAVKAVEVGKELVRELRQKGYRLIGTGEMGIGNTTPTSVLAGLLLQLPAEKVTGQGAGLSEDGRLRKVRVVKKTMQRIREVKTMDPMELLSQGGGLEIAAMCGMFLGGVEYRIPILVDGAISAISALLAERMDPRVRNYVIPSHIPRETAGREALKSLGIKKLAMIDGNLALGEGSGTMLLLPLITMAEHIYREMGSFDDYNIEPYKRYQEKK